MATVALTDYRKSSILDSVGKHLDKQYNETLNKVDMMAPALTEYIYKQIVPVELLPKIAEIPETYFIHTDSFRVLFKAGPGFERMVQIKLKHKRVVPAEKTWGNTLIITREMLEDFPNSHASAILDLYDQCIAIDKERTQLRQSIQKLLNACTTLQQLCKVFPTALNHVDENTRKMYNRRATKSEKVDPSQYLTDDLKAALVKSAIVQSAQQG